jgi:glycosyltransferase involved in cell wall biosynthesis
VLYQPKGPRPEQWFAALDLFLYAARFEEYGMVVAEAQAMGIPVLTSRRVGAAECLPAVYSPWLLDRPEPSELAMKALRLLAESESRRALATAAAATITAFDERSYASGTLRLLEDQNRRLK